jgi:hypothetical protein
MYTPPEVHKQAAWLLSIIKKHLQENITRTQPISDIVRQREDWQVIQDASSSFEMVDTPPLCASSSKCHGPTLAPP